LSQNNDRVNYGWRIRQRNSVWLLLIAALGLAPNCQKAYYATMEKFGVHKRDIMVDRVERVRKTQEDTKETFENALERFQAVVEVDGGKLEKKYNKLKKVLEKSEAKAKALSAHIDDVENVSLALFKEWEEELNDYTSDALRQQSAEQLAETRRRYRPLMAAMRKAESSVEPVLVPLRDQVLFLKHNLNARAVAALDVEVASVKTDTQILIAELESSIQEANRFIHAMKTP